MKEDRVAVAYQLFAALAGECGVFEHPEVERALDYLAGKTNENPLPWPRRSLSIGRGSSS